MYHPRFAIPRVLVGTYAFSRPALQEGHEYIGIMVDKSKECSGDFML